MRSFLELVRCVLAPTAAADSWTGFFLSRWIAGGMAGATPSGAEAGRLAGAMVVSVLLYWVGMVTNDLFDLEKDRARHPRRPLPRGAVTPARAVALSAAMTAAALSVAWIVGSLAAALCLLATLLAYNAGAKRIPGLGNLLMGICRSLNLLLGATAALDGDLLGALREPSLLWAAGVLGLYIAGVTAVSLLEDRPYRPGPLRLTQAGLLFAPVALVALGWRHPGAWINGLLLGFQLARGLAPPPTAADPAPHPAEVAVRRGLGAIYLVDAGLLWARGLAGPALGVYLLLVTGLLLRTWWMRVSDG